VLVVLTDGRANPVPASVAVDRAAAAKRDGVTLFTIGLGSDLDVDALRQMASRPDAFYNAPEGGDLVRIYRAIADRLPCPAGLYWGRR
jgi:Mg-chelatase subunit ChlD